MNRLTTPLPSETVQFEVDRQSIEFESENQLVGLLAVLL